MKKLISFILILVLLLSLSTVAFAVTKSPTVESVLMPSIMNGYFRVCDSDGNLVRYLSRDKVTCEEVDNIKDFAKIPDLLFVFKFNSAYELKDGEYIEFPVYFNGVKDLDMEAYMFETENELVIEKILDSFWLLNINEYGTIVITAVLPE